MLSVRVYEGTRVMTKKLLDVCGNYNGTNHGAVGTVGNEYRDGLHATGLGDRRKVSQKHGL